MNFRKINFKITTVFIFICVFSIFIINPSFVSASYLTNTLQWGQNGSSIYYNSGSVGIGTTGPGAKLTVQGGTQQINVFNNDGSEALDWPTAGLSIRRQEGFTVMRMLQLGHNADNVYQTGNAVWNLSLDDTVGYKTTSDANTHLDINGPGNLLLMPAGNVGIGTINPVAKLHISGTTAGNYGQYLDTVFTGTSQNVGLRFYPRQTSISTGGYYGIDARPVFASTDAGTQPVIYGLLGIPTISSSASANVTSSIGGYFRADNLSTSGSVLYNSIGVEIVNPSSAGTITNNYGLYITNQTAGSNTNYAIYSGGGTNYFSGDVGIGTPTPGTKLDIVGSLRNTLTTTFSALGGGGASSVVMTDNSGQLFATSTAAFGGLPTGTTGQTLRNNGTGWIADSNLFNNGADVSIGSTNPWYKLDVSNGGSFGLTNKTPATTGSQNLPGSLNFDGYGWNGYYAVLASRPIKGQIMVSGTYSTSSVSVEPNMIFSLQGTGGNGLARADTLTERMRITNNGLVGIGTTYPMYNLDVAGGINGTNIYINGTPISTGGGDLWSSSGANIYYTAGNVGVGTTNPLSTFNVKGTIRLSGATSGYVGLAPASAAGSVTYTLPTTAGTNGYVLTTNGSGGLSWSAGGAGSQTPWIANVNAAGYTLYGSSVAFGNLLLDSTSNATKGNVGIGTTNPLNKVQIGPNPSGWSGEDFLVSNSNGSISMRNNSGDSYIFSTNPLRFLLGSSATQAMSLSATSVDIATNINLSRATSRTIFYGTTGVAAPGAGSIGEKIQLYGTAGTVGVSDYALGIEGNNLWFNSNGGYKWYRASSPIMVIDNSSNVGIGTTGPGAKLDIIGSLKNSLAVTHSALGGLGTASLVMTDNNGQLFATSTAAIGGLPAGVTGQTLRHNGTGWIADSNLFNNGTNVSIGTTTAVGLLNVYSTASSTSGLVVSNNGYVGIGTTNPSAKLTVGNDLGLSGTGNSLVIGNTSTSGGIYTGQDSTHNLGFYWTYNATPANASALLFTYGYTNNIVIGAKDIIFSPNGTEVMRLTGSNVGIGTTNPTSKLVLSGPNSSAIGPHFRVTTDADAYPLVQQLNYSHDNIGWIFDAYWDGSWRSSDVGSNYGIYKYQDLLRFKYASGVAAGGAVTLSDAMVINTSGSVGIGTAAPGAALDVTGNFRNSLVTTHSALGGLGASSLVMTDNDGQLFAASVASVVGSTGLWGGTKNGNIWNGDAGAGNVGIGTTAPAQQLEITKNFRMTSPTNGSINGVIYKGGSRFIHDFNYGNNGTYTTLGRNTFVGINAGNFTMGATAITNPNESSSNTGVGYNALLSNASGYSNSAFGDSALYANTTGKQNSAFGDHALTANNTGSYNSAFGYNTLMVNTSGQDNTAFGYSALLSNTTGGYNSVLGYNAMIGNTTGIYNSAVGIGVMFGNQTGSYNVALGHEAGYRIAAGGSNTTSDYSVYLGDSTRARADNDQNEIVIGYNAYGIGSNTAVLGNDSITATALKGNIGIGTTNPIEKLHIYSAGVSDNPLVRIENSTRSWSLGINGTNDFFHLTDQTAGAARLAVTNGGFVGIGTTAPASVLDINGALTIEASGANNDAVINIPNSKGLVVQSNAASTVRLLPLGNDIYLQNTQSAGNIYFTGLNAASLSGNIIFNTTGKVGIGTTAPTTKLDIIGTLQNTLTVTHSILGGSGDLMVMTDNNGSLYAAARDALPTGTTGQTLRHNGTSWLANSVLFNDGTNVGIGTTAPNAKLSLANNVATGFLDNYSEYQAILYDGGSAAGSYGFGIKGNTMVFNSGAGAYSFDRSGAATSMVINTTGSVGIGTTNPLSTLDVKGTLRLTAATAGYASFALPATASSTAYTWPANPGTSGYVLTTNGSGTLSWTAASGGSQTPWTSNINAAGYTLNGNSTASGNLTLDSTSNATKGYIVLNPTGGNIGIGTAVPAAKLDINGSFQSNSSVTLSALGGGGNLLIMTDNNGILFATSTTSILGGNYLPLAGGTMAGDVNMGGNSVTNMYDLTITHKLNVATIDPLYNLDDVNYATFVSSIAGGVKEECVGKLKLENKDEITGEFFAVIDFSSIEKGSDLWVWRQVVDFNKDSIDVAVTPYGRFAAVYYLIDANKLVFRSDRPVEISYRLIGKRFDWRDWPTRAADQSIIGRKVK